MAPWRMSRDFLGSPASVTEARRFVTTFLRCWPTADAAELIVSELATNAVRHSASSRFGGRFTVTITAFADHVRLAVDDEGGPNSPTMPPSEQEEEGEGGRGLLLVAAVADDWGVSGNQRGRTVWAVLKITDLPVGAVPPQGGPAWT
ncbi:MAG TPA: ATP-binding protein [Thermopolyspora sp.]|jgi:Signal transduction histidine kinase